MATYPTGDGLLPPTIKALLAAQQSGGGTGGTVDLSGYVTNSALTTALATKADTKDLSGYVTASALSAALAGITATNSQVVAVNGTDNFTIASADTDLNKIYVIRSDASGTTNRTVNIGLTYDADGDGFLLIYNGSQTAPLILWASDCVFLRSGQPDVWSSSTSTIPVGRWMYLYRTDANSSGKTVSGGSNPAASFTVVLL